MRDVQTPSGVQVAQLPSAFEAQGAAQEGETPEKQRMKSCQIVDFERFSIGVRVQLALGLGLGLSSADRVWG